MSRGMEALVVASDSEPEMNAGGLARVITSGAIEVVDRETERAWEQIGGKAFGVAGPRVNVATAASAAHKGGSV